MLLTSNLLLNNVKKPRSFLVAPWLDDKNNFMSREDQLKVYAVPDQTTEQILAKNPGYFMSMAQGEWEEIIQQSGQAWEAIVTCFVLDTESMLSLALTRSIEYSVQADSSDVAVAS